MPAKPKVKRSKPKPAKAQAPARGPGALLEARVGIQGESLAALLQRLEALETILAQKPDGIGSRLDGLMERANLHARRFAELEKVRVASRLELLETKVAELVGQGPDTEAVNDLARRVAALEERGA